MNTLTLFNAYVKTRDAIHRYRRRWRPRSKDWSAKRYLRLLRRADRLGAAIRQRLTKRIIAQDPPCPICNGPSHRPGKSVKTTYGGRTWAYWQQCADPMCGYQWDGVTDMPGGILPVTITRRKGKNEYDTIDTLEPTIR